MEFRIASDSQPIVEKVVLHKAVRDIYDELATFIEDSTKPSRERSIALTKLEESLMWLGKAIHNE